MDYKAVTNSGTSCFNVPMWKWFVVAVVTAVIAVGVVLLELPRLTSSPVFIHRLLQSGAKSILLIGYTRKMEGQTDAFGNSFKGLCPLKDPCGHFIFAEQKFCEDGGEWVINQASKEILDEKVRPRIAEIEAKIRATSLPCHPRGQQFRLLAAGEIEWGQPLDVWTIDDHKELRALETIEP